eukprot:PhF_6_TR33513/c0_g1_i1/m.48852
MSNDEIEILKKQLRKLWKGKQTPEEVLRQQYEEKQEQLEQSEIEQFTKDLQSQRAMSNQCFEKYEETVEEYYQKILDREKEIQHKQNVWNEWECGWEEIRRLEKAQQSKNV